LRCIALMLEEPPRPRPRGHATLRCRTGSTAVESPQSAELPLRVIHADGTAASFKQQHACIRVLRQARSDHASRSPPADNDVVESGHDCSVLPCSSSESVFAFQPCTLVRARVARYASAYRAAQNLDSFGAQHHEQAPDPQFDDRR
jgi:hypothetical protein